MKLCAYAALAGIGFISFFRLLRHKGAKVSAEPAMNYKPAYLTLHEKGILKKRGEELWRILENCRLCPRECGINRLAGREGSPR